MTQNLCPGLGGNQRYKVHMSLDVARVNVNELFSGGLQKSVKSKTRGCEMPQYFPTIFII